MNRKQLILNCAIAFFAFSTTLSGCLIVFGQKKPNYSTITIPPSYARLAFGLGMIGTFTTMLIASQIEAAQIRELQALKPRPVPTPCRGCRYFHGISYNGVTLNCAVHPDGWEGAQCPDWQGFQQSK